MANSKARAPRTARKYSLGDETIRGHIRSAKTLFGWSHTFGFLPTNPTSGFVGTSRPAKANAYVPLVDFYRLIRKAPTKGWRALFGLCRLAGLRRGEALTLPWSATAEDRDGHECRIGVDWELRRLNLVAEKTHTLRVVPIPKRLYKLLVRAFDAAPEGQVTVTGLKRNNLIRNAQKIAEAAGLKPWPKLYQSLRSSCENDWKLRGIAEPTYSAWLGHSPKVSRERLSSTAGVCNNSRTMRCGVSMGAMRAGLRFAQPMRSYGTRYPNTI